MTEPVVPGAVQRALDEALPDGLDVIDVVTAGPGSLAKSLASGFEQQTGVKVTVFQATTGTVMARLEAEITHIAHGAPAAVLLMLDLDHFKHVNDTWGHATGDQVLMHLAKLLRGNLLRKDDMAGRLGGEEFAVLLPDTTLPEGLGIAERLRAALEQSQIQSDKGQTIRVTMSVGACLVGSHSGSTLASADAALYEAKNTGRNRVVQAPASGTAAAEPPHSNPAKLPH